MVDRIPKWGGLSKVAYYNEYCYVGEQRDVLWGNLGQAGTISGNIRRSKVVGVGFGRDPLHSWSTLKSRAALTLPCSKVAVLSAGRLSRHYRWNRPPALDAEYAHPLLVLSLSDLQKTRLHAAAVLCLTPLRLHAVFTPCFQCMHHARRLPALNRVAERPVE